LTARTSEKDSPVRKALVWVGGIALLPLSLLAFVERHEFWFRVDGSHTSTPLLVTGWIVAICGPLVLAVILRGRAAWANAIATVWVLVIGTFSSVHSGTTDTLAAYAWNSLGIYFWAGAGALGLVIWGLLERQRERINLGVVGFALTVLIFYFSDVMDKLGRSASLIGMGVLLLVGGWILERTRRQLIARMQRSVA
jgi:peptidoglycan/LPS O-acetylase OafA/YrhL